MNVPPTLSINAMAAAMIIPPDNAMAMCNDCLYIMRKTGPFLSQVRVINVAD